MWKAAAAVLIAISVLSLVVPFILWEASRRNGEAAARVAAANARFQDLVESARSNLLIGNEDGALNVLRQASELELVADKSEAGRLLSQIETARKVKKADAILSDAYRQFKQGEFDGASRSLDAYQTLDLRPNDNEARIVLRAARVAASSEETTKLLQELKDEEFLQFWNTGELGLVSDLPGPEMRQAYLEYLRPFTAKEYVKRQELARQAKEKAAAEQSEREEKSTANGKYAGGVSP